MQSLLEKGYDLVSGGTENHLVLVNLRDKVKGNCYFLWQEDFSCEGLWCSNCLPVSVTGRFIGLSIEHVKLKAYGKSSHGSFKIILLDEQLILVTKRWVIGLQKIIPWFLKNNFTRWTSNSDNQKVSHK